MNTPNYDQSTFRLNDDEYFERLKERFWAKVDKTLGQGPQGDCWIWTGARFKYGYGSLSRRKDGYSYSTNDYAHRISYEIHHGAIPEDKPLVCHKCDNPPCVRPDHLFLGTHADNAEDKVRKGRGLAGNLHLTREQVREIRQRKQREGLTSKQLGAIYGVYDGTIRRILRHKLWRHID